jgi:hypothetical protein
MRPVVLAALWALTQTSPTQAQDIGRLFFTPEQREALDARRKARIPDRPAAVVVESPTARLDGRVVRSSGKSTVWVNGAAVPEGTQPEGLRVIPRRDSPDGAAIAIGENAGPVDLRVGETLDRGTGEVKSAVGAATIKVERQSPRR